MLRFANELGKRNGEIEYRGGKVLQRRRGSGGNARLFQLLMTFLSFDGPAATSKVSKVNVDLYSA